METQDLKDYLGMVVDMEASCDLLNRLQQDLRRQLASIRDPQPKQLALPIQPVKPVKPEKKYKHLPLGTVLVFVVAYSLSVISMALAFAGAGFCLELLDALICALLGANLDDPSAYAEWNAFILGLGKFGGLCGIVLGFPMGIKVAMEYRKADKEELNSYVAECRNYERNMETYEQSYKNYQQAMEEYRVAAEKDRQSMERETKKVNNKRSFLRKSLADLDIKVRESAQCLQELYSRNIIHPKFRDFISVCSLYEYIDTGMCSTLEGDYGAYRLLEQAKMTQQVITRLDVIIQQLNAIQENQYALFTVLQTNQQILNHISASNRRILAELDADSEGSGDMQSDEASAYFEERRQRERDYRNNIDDFR